MGSAPCPANLTRQGDRLFATLRVPSCVARKWVYQPSKVIGSSGQVSSEFRAFQDWRYGCFCGQHPSTEVNQRKRQVHARVGPPRRIDHTSQLLSEADIFSVEMP